MLFYRAAVDLSRSTLNYVAGMIRRHRKQIASTRWLWGILRALEKAGVLTLADKGYQGAEATVVITPYKGRNKPEVQKQANRSHARLRGPGERANAQLKSWRILRKLRCSPSKAIAVLQNHHIAHATNR